MIRLLAWCGMNQSMSSADVPVALKASTITSVIIPTACLNTSRPSMRRWPTVCEDDGQTSTYNLDMCRPSERRAVVRGAPPALGCDAGLRRRVQHDGAAPVAEQHAGAAVVPVENAGKGFGSD